MSSPSPTAFQRCCVTAVAAAMLLQPLAVYAAPISTSILAKVPLQGLNPVKPNIMFTVDDSGSMNQEYLPDFAAEGVTNTATQIYYCRDSRHCGGIANSLVGPWVISTADPPIRSRNHNGQFYDPAATYLPARRADGTTLPYESASPGTWTSVYPNGFAGYPGANSSTPTNLVTGYPDTAWCNNQASNPPSAADLATAVGGPNLGSKCRLNGRAYPSWVESTNLFRVPSIAAGYNYPNLKDVATGGNTACAFANEYCVFNVPGTVSGNPYYYTITNIQYCSTADALGFGTGTCQARWDQDVYKYIRYGNLAQSFDPQAFARIDIVPATLTYPSGRTYAQEMTNFAKWYTFYRDRINAMKTAGGIAFAALSEDNARVGLHTLNQNATHFLNVAPFNTAQKTEWFNRFYAIVPNGGTPLPDATFRVGEYFANSGASTLPGATDPLDATFGQCQPNYHLLATDGYWNNPNVLTGGIADSDGTVPATLPGPIPNFIPGNPFPRPFRQGPIANSTSLSDLAMHYWINDLRPTLANRVNDAIAPWQHVTLYGLAIGLQGTTVYPTGLDAITAGTADWPNPIPPAGFLGGGPEAGDDLWHAAINSRGKFFNADTPQQLAESIVAAIADFTDQSGTGTSVGIAGPQFTATRSFGYRVSYESGWWGDVKKYALNPDTGELPVDNSGNPLNPAIWSAATQLDAMVLGNGWNTNRRIVTLNDAGLPVRFRLGAGGLSPGQEASLIAGWVASSAAVIPTTQSVLDYLRGDKSNEGTDPSVPNLRVRTHALGDIGYSGAVAVGPPSQPYLDAGNPGYQSFVTNRALRTPMVYVGANDGMVHAFDDSTGPNGGKESWAFVPKALYSGGDPNDTAHTPDPAFQLGALSYRRGGIPLFDHKFYVNATARAWDVDFANTNTNNPPQTGNDWHSILVGGLGAGGRSVYALDITTPPASTETEATIASSGRVLWEFSDANLGYVYDSPTIVKTFAYGWVVLVPSGYNNPGGKGFLYVLNPTNGAILQKLPLPGDTGTDAAPTGLSTIRAYTASRRDPLALQAYGGDLKGNVWRFDLSDANPANWSSSVARVAKLTDASGNEQPITTGVRIEIDQTNNVDRYLFVGTGKLLGPADFASNAVRNTLYVIRDGNRTTPDPAPATPYGRTNLNSVNGTSISGFTGTPTGRGWFQDAIDLTEKIGTDVFADVQTVVFAFSKPTTDPCAAPLSSRLYARDLNSGNSVLIAPTGGIVPGYDIGSGIAGVQLIQGQPGSGGTASGEIRALVTTMKGEVFSFAISPPASPAARHRVSWRLLNKN